MARPIKDTPTLKGKDAKKFLKKFEKVKENKIPFEDWQENINAYNQMFPNSPDKPLSCGAHVWIETQSEVKILK